MSEYWKSTPKYWCKFCKTYVRDTKFERQQHEATGRHQSNIQRSLRTLHKDSEREEREKQRAKDEVARLNGVVSGGASTGGGDAATRKSVGGGTAAAQPARQATVEDRKRQMQQLAEMGIAIPDEFRRDMAMAGEWKTVSETPIVAHDSTTEAKSIGVRKRKLEGEDEDEDVPTGPKKPQWGSSKKLFPGSAASGDDFEALLGGSITAVKTQPAVKDEPEAVIAPATDTEGADGEEDGEDAAITKAEAVSAEDVKTEATDTAVPVEAPLASLGVVFKKRKKKP